MSKRPVRRLKTEDRLAVGQHPGIVRIVPAADVGQLPQDVFAAVEPEDVLRRYTVDSVLRNLPVDIPDQAGIFVLPADLFHGLADDDFVVVMEALVLLVESGQDVLDPLLIVVVPGLGNQQHQMAVADLEQDAAAEIIRREPADHRLHVFRKHLPFPVEFRQEEAQVYERLVMRMHIADHVLHGAAVHRAEGRVEGIGMHDVHHRDNREQEGNRGE